MYEYGGAPSADVAEVTVFGPGFGEAIAVHVGDGNWLLVDSCRSPQSGEPASLEYLDRIGVPRQNIRSIIASHWHDDHIRGVANIVKACPHAELHISAAFDKKEASAFLSAYGGRSAAVHTGGAKELFNAVSLVENPLLVQQRTLIWDGEVQSRRMRAVAYSPTPAALAQSMAHMAQYIPSVHTPIKHAPSDLKPNLEAVVISIDLGDDGILLGSDLEDHGKNGWSAVVGNSWCIGNQKASLYKVSHHGSITGHHDEIWTKLLSSTPVSTMTPFIHGAHNLPTADDRQRIIALSSDTFISSNGTKRSQLDSHLKKRMGDLAKKLKPINSGFGVVRLRKKLGAKDWVPELFGQAARLA